jgi:two-component system, OmpR family, sensor histidine kinase KdpD
MRTTKAIMMQTSDTALERNSSPKMLCRAAGRKRRGRLKIFLGAAPGVGTTCEMIRAGISKHRERVDVVVGAVETHGRKETESLLKELEVIPNHGGAFNCRRVCERHSGAATKARARRRTRSH